MTFTRIALLKLVALVLCCVYGVNYLASGSDQIDPVKIEQSDFMQDLPWEAANKKAEAAKAAEEAAKAEEARRAEEEAAKAEEKAAAKNRDVPEEDEEEEEAEGANADDWANIEEREKGYVVTFHDFDTAIVKAQKGKKKKVICIYFHSYKDKDYPKVILTEAMKSLEGKLIIFSEMEIDPAKPGILITKRFGISPKELPAMAVTDWYGNPFLVMKNNKIKTNVIEGTARSRMKRHNSMVKELQQRIPRWEKLVDEKKYRKLFKTILDFQYLVGFKEAQKTSEILETAIDDGLTQFHTMQAEIANAPAGKKRNSIYRKSKPKMKDLLKEFEGTEVADEINEYFDRIKNKKKKKKGAKKQ